MATAIQASHIIAYDGEQHRHLQNGVVVYEDNTITHVGQTYDGPIDATGRVVTPGFINTHAHLEDRRNKCTFQAPRRYWVCL